MSKILSNPPSNEQLVIKFGAPVLRASFKRVKFITTCLCLLLIIDLFFSFKLFISAIQIRSHIGYFINMITSGDGDILPSMQAVPVLFFTLTNIAMVYLTYKAFSPKEGLLINRLMFIAALVGLFLLIILFIVIISVIVHAYGVHQSLHDGIVTAMSNYSSNIKYKVQMDKLQIEFQCCGSKKYDEWYEIKWFDDTLEQGGKGNGSMLDGNTPFSCCSIKSMFPCIHHDIETTGKAYLYTPEFNLSISTRGCYEMIRERKQEVGWSIVGNLCIYLLLETFTVAAFRFIQTAHSEKTKFLGNTRMYTMWLFGCYSGKVKRPQDVPDPPPMPPELME